ncbi:MAG: dihydroorotate dehydrogenase electron transfer subunit [Alistipes sp.]|nr:dihydroorotate dehydrogenase electron transfer subunit [Alistipes sp.]
MSRRGTYVITENRSLTPTVFRMRLAGDTRSIMRPGQFIDIALEGLFLRRPISVCDYDAESISIIYKVVGRGTRQMSRLQCGDSLDCLVGLGNGFSVETASQRPLLVGGGVGLPPMYNLCKQLIAAGKKPQVVMGFNTAGEVFYRSEFENLGVDVFCATADGSLGVKGFVTDAIGSFELKFDYIYACGPAPMLRALYDRFDIDGEFSFEERMGCGFGACMGCTCKTKYGNKRICVDGPVLKREEIIW